MHWEQFRQHLHWMDVNEYLANQERSQSHTDNNPKLHSRWICWPVFDLGVTWKISAGVLLGQSAQIPFSFTSTSSGRLKRRSRSCCHLGWLSCGKHMETERTQINTLRSEVFPIVMMTVRSRQLLKKVGLQHKDNLTFLKAEFSNIQLWISGLLKRPFKITNFAAEAFANNS